jgi:hypothetical protein
VISFHDTEICSPYKVMMMMMIIIINTNYWSTPFSISVSDLFQSSNYVLMIQNCCFSSDVTKLSSLCVIQRKLQHLQLFTAESSSILLFLCFLTNLLVQFVLLVLQITVSDQPVNWFLRYTAKMKGRDFKCTSLTFYRDYMLTVTNLSAP